MVTQESFGSLVRRYRREAELTQEGLAERAGLSVRAVRDIETGSQHRPRRDTLQLLLAALAVPAEEQASFLAAAAHVAEQRETVGTLPATAVQTFLIADIRNYTRFTLEHGDEAAARLARRFAEIAGAAVSGCQGDVLEVRGDEVLAAFSSARQALRAALDLQARVRQEQEASVPLLIGIGLDAGEAVPVQGGYRGAALNLAARLCALAGPGEVLASETLANLARKVEGVTYLDRGLVELKGIAAPVRVVLVQPSAPMTPTEEARSGPPLLGEEQGSPRLPLGGFLGALPTGPLVAREQELSRILAAGNAVAQGQGRLLLLAGEPGVGKTRLAQEATLELGQRGFLVATGRCYASHRVVPYFPFLEALAQVHTAAPTAIRADAPRRWPYLGRLLPDQIGTNSISSAPSPDEQLRLFWTVTGFLVAVAGARPLALMLDDLHWADQASLDLLQHLARHTRGERIIFVGTYREAEARGKHPLAQAHRDLARDDLVERVPIQRLSRDGTEGLIGVVLGGGAVPSELIDLVHRSTEGNAFFTKEVARALLERGDLERQNGGWRCTAVDELAVPETVRSAIDERLARLQEAAQELLRQASVLGQTFTFGDLQGTSGSEEEEVEVALAEAAAVGLVRETDPEQYGFDHALTQQALYAQLSGRRRRKLHRAAAEALARLSPRAQEGRAAELAWHFEAGGEPERAVPFAVAAGDQAAAVFAHSQAEAQYRRALRLARGDEPAAAPDTGMEADLLRKLGLAIALQSRYGEALRVWEEAVRVSRSAGDRETEWQVVAEIGKVHASQGTLQDGVTRIHELLAALSSEDSGDQPSRGLYELYEALTFAHFFGGRFEDALSAAESAAHQARMLGDERILARAEVYRGSMLGPNGHLLEGIRVTEGAIPALESHGDSFELCLGQGTLGDFYLLSGELQRAREVRARGVAVAERIGEPGWLALFLSFLALDCFYLGDWEQARVSCERAADLLRRSALDRSWSAAYPPLVLGTLGIAEGSWEEAATLLQRAVEIAEPSHDMQALTLALLPLAERDLLEGHPQEAVARLRPALASADAGLFGSLLRPLLGLAYLELDEIDQAEEIVSQAVSFARRERAHLCLVEALPVQALVLARQRRAEEAQQAFEEAVQSAKRMAYGYGEARALFWWGAAGIQREDPVHACQHLSQALASFQRLGAAPYIAWTEDALARLAL